MDVRVLAATNRNLEALVAKRRFREDLYYRLCVIPIALPPLRARRADVPVLLEHFLARFSERNGRMPPACPSDVLKVLKRYDWPGNVRELENLAERLVILCVGDVVGLPDLPPKFTEPGRHPLGSWWEDEEDGPPLPEGGIRLKRYLQRLEQSLIDQALARTGGNRNRAAKLLGLNRTTLVEKLRKRGD